MQTARRSTLIATSSPVAAAAPRWLLGLLLAIACPAFAKDVAVVPQASINAAISAATTLPGDRILVPAGTYTGGLIVNKSVTVEAVGDVIVRPEALGKGPAISIRCSDCAVVGFTFEDFGSAVFPDKNTGRDRVMLKNLVFRRGTAGLWISGDKWLVDGVEIDGLRLARDAEDYGNVFGAGHTIRRCYFHGLRIPLDLGPGPDFKHNDAFQFWNNNGETLRDLLIEECIFTDFVQGIFLANETGVASSMANITIRNNVFWGTNFIEKGNLIGMPSHGVFVGKAPIAGVTITNNLFHKVANCVSLYAMTSAAVEGNIIAKGGTAYAVGDGTEPRAFVRGAKGNLLWKNGWNGYPEQGPDQYLDPALANVESLLGPDGLPWTADDGWRPTAPEAENFGPQLSAK